MLLTSSLTSLLACTAPATLIEKHWYHHWYTHLFHSIVLILQLHQFGVLITAFDALKAAAWRWCAVLA
jgi:hypothetical protein